MDSGTAQFEEPDASRAVPHGLLVAEMTAHEDLEARARPTPGLLGQLQGQSTCSREPSDPVLPTGPVASLESDAHPAILNPVPGASMRARHVSQALNAMFRECPRGVPTRRARRFQAVQMFFGHTTSRVPSSSASYALLDQQTVRRRTTGLAVEPARCRKGRRVPCGYRLWASRLLP